MPYLLVIDDEPLTLDCFRYLFPKTEVTVATAATAADGTEQFTKQRPDAVVLDVRLPDLSGLEAFRRLHTLDPKVPVILMTGHGTADTAIEAMRLGAFEYVLKPPDTDKLRDMLQRAFATSRPCACRRKSPRRIRTIRPPTCSWDSVRPCKRCTRPSDGWLPKM